MLEIIIFLAFYTSLKKVLQTFSSALYKSTNGQISLTEIFLEYPEFLPPTEFLDPKVTQLPDKYLVPIRIVDSEEEICEAQKPTPCEISGDQIIISDKFIRNYKITELSFKDSRDHYQWRTIKILQEWAKYRWGVFDENAVLNQTSFFDRFYKEEPTQCTDREPTIMFSSDFEPRKMNSISFCDAYDHVSIAPTNNNKLCDRRSTWEILKTHRDFLVKPEVQEQLKQLTVQPVRRASRKIVIVFNAMALIEDFGEVFTQILSFIRVFLYIAKDDNFRIGIVEMGARGLRVWPTGRFTDLEVKI